MNRITNNLNKRGGSVNIVKYNSTEGTVNNISFSLG